MSFVLNCMTHAPIAAIALGAFLIFAIGVFATVAWQAAGNPNPMTTKIHAAQQARNALVGLLLSRLPAAKGEGVSILHILMKNNS